MTYESMANFARTGGLIYMLVLFAGVLIYTFRPGSRKKFDDAARIPLKED